jgi:5'-nucleotidase
VKTIDGVRVAFIGTVTTDTARMVDPQGIKDIDGDQLEAANRVADKISNGDLADVTALPRTRVVGVEPVRCGRHRPVGLRHPHPRGIQPHRRHRLRAHAPDIRVQRAVAPAGSCDRSSRRRSTARRSASSLQYDTDAHELVSATGSTQALAKAYPADAAVASMVAGFTAQASTIGSKPVGAITADILRGGKGGSDAESSRRWATPSPTSISGPRAPTRPTRARRRRSR